MTRNAEGNETTVEVQVGEEQFSASGIVVTQQNYLQIYDKWSEKMMPNFKEGESIKKYKLDLKEGVTTAPSHLSEADLISQMDDHGIGTDATIHEHIKNI